MSRQSGPEARGCLRVRSWEKLATGSTRRVPSNCWRDLGAWLRDLRVGVHETPGGKRIQGQLPDRLYVGVQLLERATLHIYLYFSYKWAFISISQRGEQDEAMSAVCVHMCLPVLICAAGQVFIYMYCIHAFVCMPTENTSPASPLVRAGRLELWQPCLHRAARFGNPYEPVLTFQHR